MHNMFPNSLLSFLIRSLENSDEFAINIISKYYPLSSEQLIKYTSKLSWSSVAMKENVYWSEELFENFKGNIPLCSLSNNEKFPWTEEFIAANFQELFYYQGEPTNISSNKALP